MGVKVVDASVLGAIVFGEPGSSDLVERLAGSKLVAPVLLPYELTSIALKKIQIYKGETHKIKQALAAGLSMQIELVDPDQQSVLDLALKTKLTTYDAAYLFVARQLHAELITLDKALGKQT